jgi:23S rRNA (guanosine2251-2'-O)-methyltransferase
MTRHVLGPRAVTEALRAHPGTIAVIYAEAVGTAHADVEALAQKAKVRFERVASAQLDTIAAGQRHQGVLAIAGEYVYTDVEHMLNQAAAHPLFLALDQISDPHNLGAIVRSAAAFAADGVITLKDRAAPVTPVVVRASAGATEHARIARVTNLARTLDMLKQQGLEVVGLDAQGGVELADLPFASAGRVLVVGSEGEGLRRLTQQKCDVLAKISLPGQIASLNASVAAGIALHASARARAAL